MAWAHSSNSQGKRHDLVDHLRGVAGLAAEFAAEFGCAEPARVLGLYHDLGKFSTGFQDYLLASEAGKAHGRSPDHKIAGASFIVNKLGLPLFALLIQGHHGGLRKASDLRSYLSDPQKSVQVDEALTSAKRGMPDLETPVPRMKLPKGVEGDAKAAELFLRILFSALVDADFLDTEMHFEARTAARRGTQVTMVDLWQWFERDQERFGGEPKAEVNLVRAEVYRHCLEASKLPPGMFRLTVPTGGGKTRSAMAFALQHAIRFGHRRVIVAVPFISITEQTADVYRGIFGSTQDDEPIVLEHHSQAGQGDGDDMSPRTVRSRLAAENWDAPIIVTTTVQLFESLFANTPSRCRRVHSLAHSVIILDEAQALPAHLLQPILDGLRELCASYGATVVISTATQPAFEAIPIFAAEQATEIIPDPERLFRTLKRVEYEWRMERGLEWEEVAKLLDDTPQALAVVNTKKDAMALLDALGDGEALHLSTLLCGAHRREVIRTVRRRLELGEPCRLISTQVVEAGVDLDFPLVLRAMGPLDSILQSAGRCNREGRLRSGRVVVFRPVQGGMPKGAYRAASGITAALLGAGDVDPDDPAASREYFRRLFATIDTDRESIQKLRETLDYPEVARRFRMIDGSTQTVAVPYGSEDERRQVQAWLERLREGATHARGLMRRLQPYVVSLYAAQAAYYRQHGLIVDVVEGMGEWMGKYDPVRGLSGDALDPDALVV
ncbi:MAG: CRISPR-associated endonuclease Cas3'' [Chloroflexi bacterium]|nr:CRISPR-associated endonuclease Cas3'' [Chloroflexota bacterium]